MSNARIHAHQYRAAGKNAGSECIESGCIYRLRLSRGWYVLERVVCKQPKPTGRYRFIAYSIWGTAETNVWV